MRASIIAGSLVAGLLSTAPLQAQRIGADVVVRTGPIAGHVVIGDGYSTYRRPVARRVVVVERYAPRVVVVERVHRKRHGKHWRRHGYRPVVVYYVDGRYYDRPLAARYGARELLVYERDGRYYHDCDHDERYHWDD